MSKNRPKTTLRGDTRDLLGSAVSGVDLPKSDLVIPPAKRREPVDNWQVVVVGNIDSRQVNPRWLQLIGSIDDAEVKEGDKTLSMIVVPTVAIGEGRQRGSGIPQPDLVQFDVGAFAVTVVPDKWIIQTVVGDNRTRLADVSANAFRKLNEIHITAFGINKHWTVKLRKTTAKQLLGEKLRQTDLALPDGDIEGQLNYKCRSGGIETNIQLSPSPIEDRWLQVNYNRHHQISGTELAGTGYYDVGKMILDGAEADWQSASQYAAELSESIARAEGK